MRYLVNPEYHVLRVGLLVSRYWDYLNVGIIQVVHLPVWIDSHVPVIT